MVVDEMNSFIYGARTTWTGQSTVLRLGCVSKYGEYVYKKKTKIVLVPPSLICQMSVTNVNLHSDVIAATNLDVGEDEDDTNSDSTWRSFLVPPRLLCSTSAAFLNLLIQLCECHGFNKANTPYTKSLYRFLFQTVQLNAPRK